MLEQTRVGKSSWKCNNSITKCTVTWNTVFFSSCPV